MEKTPRLQELLTELADIEKQRQDKTLPHSDQQLLDQAWNDIQNQIDDYIEDRYPEPLEVLLPTEEEYEITIAPSPKDVLEGRVTLEDLDLDYDSDTDDEEDEERLDCRYCSGCSYCEYVAEYDGFNEV
jgi:phage gp36-like protein